MSTPVLEIRNAGKVFRAGGRDAVAVKSMSVAFPTERPRLITLAGESGCGKSTLALMALGFVAPTIGEVLYCGRDIAKLDRARFRDFRRNVQAIFQNPYEAFNPVYRVERTLRRAIRLLDQPGDGAVTRERVEAALLRVKLDPKSVLGRFPHQLSGGQLQRITIARAMLIRPKILIADEPVSMVDASLRIFILRQLIEMKTVLGISILYITHDLSTALQISDELLIAYRGEVVERGEPAEVIGNPKSDYTRLLVSSVPVPDPRARWTTELALAASGADHAYDR
jgi:peptide/nickel transport system ATP-binding protein